MKSAAPVCLASCLVAASLLSQCAPAGGVSLSPKPEQIRPDGVLPVIQAPESIRFAGKTWRAGYSAASPSEGMALVEYFLPGENRKNSKKTVSLRLLARKVTPMQQLQADARLEQSPATPYPMPGGEAGMDTVTVVQAGARVDLMRVAPLTGRPGIKGLQYAEEIPAARVNALGGEGLLKSVAGQRKEMQATPVPDISLKS